MSAAALAQATVVDGVVVVPMLTTAPPAAVKCKALMDHHDPGTKSALMLLHGGGAAPA